MSPPPLSPSRWSSLFSQRPVVFVGLGNRLRGDDAVGPLVVERLAGKVPAVCLDAGTTPENYLGRIIRENPRLVVLVDALHWGAAPGEFTLLRENDLLPGGFTTHDVSPEMVMRQLRESASAEVVLLGIQPDRLALGEPLTDALARAVDRLVSEIERAFRG